MRRYLRQVEVKYEHFYQDPLASHRTAEKCRGVVEYDVKLHWGGQTRALRWDRTWFIT